MNNLVNFITRFLGYESNIILGRWCHISIPQCCEKVINKKIDFANMDNNFSLVSKKETINKSKIMNNE